MRFVDGKPARFRMIYMASIQPSCAVTYLVERVRLDLGEFVLHVVGIHRLDLLPRRCAEDFDDLHQLVYATFAREERLSQHELRHDTSG